MDNGCRTVSYKRILKSNKCKPKIGRDQQMYWCLEQVLKFFIEKLFLNTKASTMKEEIS